MLSIYFGDMPEAIFNTSVYFKNAYLDEWLLDPFDQKMIKSVDGATVLGPNAVQTKVLGVVAPTGLSGGAKTLMLINHVEDQVFNASACGDNCAKWILRMAKKRDITINLRHIMDFGKGSFDIYIINADVTVHSMADLVEVAVRYV